MQCGTGVYKGIKGCTGVYRGIHSYGVSIYIGCNMAIPCMYIGTLINVIVVVVFIFKSSISIIGDT